MFTTEQIDALKQYFDWYEDDHMLSLRCRTCLHLLVFTHRAQPLDILADLVVHLTGECRVGAEEDRFRRILDALPLP